MRYLWLVGILIGAIGYKLLFEKQTASPIRASVVQADCPKPAPIKCPKSYIPEMPSEKPTTIETGKAVPVAEDTVEQNTDVDDSTKPFRSTFKKWTYSSFDEDFEKKFASKGFSQFQEKLEMLHAAHDSGLINPGTVEKVVVTDLEAFLKGEKEPEDERNLISYFLYAQQSMQRTSPELNLLKQIERLSDSPTIDRGKINRLREVLGQ